MLNHPPPPTPPLVFVADRELAADDDVDIDGGVGGSGRVQYSTVKIERSDAGRAFFLPLPPLLLPELPRLVALALALAWALEGERRGREGEFGGLLPSNPWS